MNKEYQDNSYLPFCKVTTCLSAEAQSYLADTTDGTSHYAVLNQLIRDTSVREATTSKHGITIRLKPGRVDCSVNSLCRHLSLGRKATEAVMKEFERLGIIRMHRSKLASIGDMICITSWQLHDGTVISNDILHDLSDPLEPVKARKNRRVSKAVDSKPKKDPLEDNETHPTEDSVSAASQVSSIQSGRSMPSHVALPVRGILPSDDGLPQTSVTSSTAENPTESKGASADYTLDLFGDQFASEEDVCQV